MVYNFGREDWDYGFADRDNDGMVEFEFGPKTAEGMMPKVTFRWDKKKKAYIGPKAKTDDHFRVINAEHIYEELERLKVERVVFPNELKLPPNMISKEKLSRSNPYVYRSFNKDATNDEFMRYMGKGKNIDELKQQAIIKTRVPQNFWTMTSKDAALAIADANRGQKHRARYSLSVDAGAPKPSEVCSVECAIISDKSYSAIDCRFILRADPKGSYLIFTQSSGPGIVFYNFVYAQPAFDLRYCELSYDDAKHIAHTIWWLKHTRSNIEDDWLESSGGMWSSADGHGAIRFVCHDEKLAFDVSKTYWAGEEVSRRWNRDYDDAVFLNLACYLFRTTLTDRLGATWTKFQPKRPQHTILREHGPQYETNDSIRLHETTARLIEMGCKGELPPLIVCDAVRTAGVLVFSDLAPRLKELRIQLGASTKPVRTKAIIEAEREVIWRKAQDKYGKKGVQHDKSELNRWRALYDEEFAQQLGLKEDGARETLREAIALALRQIEAAENPEALRIWASSQTDGCLWALQRLSETDTKRYVMALEWWLKASGGKWARQAYAAILTTDPIRAKELAIQMPADNAGNLTVQVFSVLNQAKEITDEDQRIDALIKVALNPESGWHQRSEAINLLVPDDKPLRYPAKKIDDALLKLLDPKLGDETLNFTLQHACEALARRRQLEYFGQILDTLVVESDDSIYHGILAVLVNLAQQGGAEFTMRLLPALKTQLTTTKWQIPSDIIWAIWIADLRELKPDLERIATSASKDYEGRKSMTVDGRYHLARQVAALWNEEDALARAKLLIAFDCEQYADNFREGKRGRMKTELEKLTGILSAQQKNELLAFLVWCEKKHKVNGSLAREVFSWR